ncbi:hypothetical protein ABNC55_17860 [Paenibacillus larvae]
MKRRFKFLTHLVPLFVLAIATSGCGSDSSKTANSSTAPESTPAPSATVSPSPKPTEEPEDDIWTYYDNAKWEDNFKGLKSEIVSAGLSDKAPNLEDSSKKVPLVGVYLSLENTTDKTFTTELDFTRLVTSTGEQLERPQVIQPDANGRPRYSAIGGEIEKGVKKEATLVWELKKSKAEDVDWIKLKWKVHTGGEDDMDGERKTYEVELKLK